MIIRRSLENARLISFCNDLQIIIPQDVGLTILKGAVMYGLDPTS